MHPITHDGKLLAIATARGVLLAPHIEQLDAMDPLRRLTLALSQHAGEAIARDPRTKLDAQIALRYAGELLIPVQHLPAGGYDDHVARELAVPVELVRRRRRDLGQPACWPTPAVPWTDDRSYRAWTRGTTLPDEDD